jgi:hypothetical protein
LQNDCGPTPSAHHALEPVKRPLAISSMLRILFAVVINLMIDCSLRPFFAVLAARFSPDWPMFAIVARRVQISVYRMTGTV